ncbi:hypothetical protein [Sinanaerobacter chloroacetimidivorans]|jgi:hypothetical protein|uniref:Uncharacterized protein n=1 Tax=Sinanaerobacter chloroacetimidivorans TaxID=2818044 RepID=A0A8J7W1G3_9FIRM|nr:hypothetical protein [Sinanaerobacter chloroacetimidivorans]MBR0597406.1 hypothetical protein [Sinanaerobacter chloroacetimidivorans]
MGRRSDSDVLGTTTRRRKDSDVLGVTKDRDFDLLSDFRRSRCFLVVWKDERGRRRCKCCCRD